MITAILKREWLRIKPSIFSLIMFSILLTISLFLVIGFPFYSIINTINGMKFMYWVSPGIWIFMSSLMGYILSMDGINSMLNEKRQIEAFCSMPISNKQILLGIFIWAIIIAFVQWNLSYLLTSLLNNDFFSLIQFFRLMFQSFPSIIFFAGLGILSSLLTTNRYWQITLSFLYFSILGFGLGCFIPINYFPLEIKSVLEIIPITNLINGAHEISFQNPGSFTGGLFSFMFGIFFLLISIGISNKRFRK